MNFVLVPGAWAGAWVWDDVARHLRNKGHPTHQLTLSGLDGGVISDEISLNTHVEDVRSYISGNDVRSVVLVGHSYSGIVAGQVASQYPDLIRRAVFVEAFLPVAGRSLLEVSGLNEADERAAIAANAGSWPPPPSAELASQPMLSDAHVRLLSEKLQPHPGQTVTDAAELRLPLTELTASFIAHDGWLSGSREKELIRELRACDAWAFHPIEGGHWPMLTVPEELSDLLHSCEE